ncbi:hypothetical protein CBER1_10127 [Cercospora berteroae]|uniref:Uncharacterized protein n=1 Tax=Cercospora berteroae TaxID=357750 RepID=A0A2S6CKD0_9PEZI|nr:hypothetical protein CBER1_10127 [Cercospora berteroae]
MATIADIDSLILRDLLESLPQELYDYVYKLTFTAEKKIHVYTNSKAEIDTTLAALVQKLQTPTITLNESFPHLLHVDQASREHFATSYFGTSGSIFIKPLANTPVTKLSVITAEHFALMAKIYVTVTSRRLQLFIQQRMNEDDRFAPYRAQAVICLLEDTVQLIEAHAKLHKKGGAEQGEVDSGSVKETKNEDNGAEGVVASLWRLKGAAGTFDFCRPASLLGQFTYRREGRALVKDRYGAAPLMDDRTDEKNRGLDRCCWRLMLSFLFRPSTAPSP